MMFFRFVHCYIYMNSELDSDYLAHTVRKWCVHSPQCTKMYDPNDFFPRSNTPNLKTNDTLNPMMVFSAFEVRTIIHQPTQCIVS